ncbi:hypothetical protein G5V57_02365 [Nordella sp. HKS 07]|uniref:hypothetical protein n=1 Tax=Nordella sp. HKS 07 TaxID=2712222 RepID=UPI0013E1AEFD|nr:hypothetical protein [Nordella sp. HKS 07]QIG46699.1 hypothetical protein G5V57_02365 [Nordella sp. HKS 07]
MGTSVYRAFLLLALHVPILSVQAVFIMAHVRDSRKNIEEKLDEALRETFPASDPVSVGRNDRPGQPATPPAEKPGTGD